MIFWCHFYLPVGTFQVNSQKPVRAGRSIKDVIYPGKWVSIFVCYRVYFPIIHAKSCNPIFVAKTIGDTQGLLEGEIIPLVSISVSKLCTVSRCGSGTLLAGCQMGVASLVSMYFSTSQVIWTLCYNIRIF